MFRLTIQVNELKCLLCFFKNKSSNSGSSQFLYSHISFQAPALSLAISLLLV